jgi:hypothetical protein
MSTPTGHPDLLGGPPPTLLRPSDADAAAIRAIERGEDPSSVAAAAPTSSLAWAVLAEQSLDDAPVTSYAYARTGYHRGLDQLRRSGWKGHGPVPWSHEPNRGFLRALAALSRAAGAIGEDEERDRCRAFLADSDPAAAAELGLA